MYNQMEELTNTVSESIAVLASGKGWLAVEKPAGMSVHNDPGKDVCSFAADLIANDPALAENTAFDPKFGIHPVHRLDRQTSGVILLACRSEIFRYFSLQFEKGLAEKKYIAILHGELKENKGIWEWPLSAEAGGRNLVQGKGKKQQCRTEFCVLRHTPHYTCAECHPLTGRKHQIRRHAKLAGHPVTGDNRYGSLRAVRYLEDNCNFKRMGLHAMSLSITLPGESKARIIQSQGMPQAMEMLLQNDVQ